MRFKRALVTGGAGFIGSHLVDEMAKQGMSVTVLDNLSNGKLGNIGLHLKGGSVRFFEGDVRDADVINDALLGVDAVFHLASITSVPLSVRFPEETLAVNVEGTRNLLEACVVNGVERFIFASSCAVYGEPKYLPIDEGHPANPISPYAKSKLKAEQLCQTYKENYGLKTTNLRPFNVYGSRQKNDGYAGVISRFIEELRFGKSPVIHGDGLQTRDFVYVSDVVDAFVSALSCKAAFGRFFNVGSGVPVSVNELACLLIELFGIDGVEPLYVDEREGDIKHSYANINKACQYLGFEPRVSLKDGLLTLIG